VLRFGLLVPSVYWCRPGPGPAPASVRRRTVRHPDRRRPVGQNRRCAPDRHRQGSATPSRSSHSGGGPGGRPSQSSRRARTWGNSDPQNTDTAPGREVAKVQVSEDASSGYWWTLSIPKSVGNDASSSPVSCAMDRESAIRDPSITGRCARELATDATGGGGSRSRREWREVRARHGMAAHGEHATHRTDWRTSSDLSRGWRTDLWRDRKVRRSTSHLPVRTPRLRRTAHPEPRCGRGVRASGGARP